MVSTITKSITIGGDIGAVYDALKKTLADAKFAEVSTTWPSYIELSRGKGSLLAKSVKDAKTVLKVSLKQAADNVDILLEYTFSLPASYVKDNEEIEEEFVKIKHSISDAGRGSGDGLVCDICFMPLRQGDKFCRSCGRSAGRRAPAKAAPSSPAATEVAFDPTRVPFGQKLIDDALCGGIPNNAALLITSPACEEKDMIMTRFMEAGLDQQETVVYVSTDNVAKKLKSKPAFYHVLCNPQADLMVPEQAKNVVKIKGVDRLTELSMVLTSLLGSITTAADNSRKRLVLNILSDMLLSSQAVNTRKWIGETITKFKVKDFTIVALLNPHMHSKEETHALLDMFDGQIDIYERESSHDLPQMFMRIKRLSNSRYSSKEIELAREDLWVSKPPEGK